LIGPPTNEKITLNINGKQQAMAAGDKLRITPDSSTVCQVNLNSFDMFKAVVYAACEMADMR
jgi:D-lyxose ketol-isomerase